MSLKRGIVFTLLTQAPTLLLFFISSTLMTRLLGDEGRGAYALLTSQIALLSMLLWMNLGFGITYFTSRNDGPDKRIVGTAVTILLLELLITPLVLLFIHYVDGLHDVFMPKDARHWGYYGFIFASIILGTINSTISAILLGMKKFKVLNWMSIMNAGLSATGFLLLFLVLGDAASKGTLPQVLVISLLVQISLTAIWVSLYAINVGIVPVPCLQWRMLRPMLTFSLVGHLSNLINLINYRFDVWVVDSYHGTSALGLYAVAVGMAQLLFYIPEPFARVVQPYLYGQRKGEMLERFKAISRVNFSVVLALSAIIAVAAHWIIPFLFGDIFNGSVSALRLLLPGVVFSSAFKLLAQLVVQGDGQRFNLYATSAGAFVTIVLDLLLIPIWGINGAAIASTLSYLTIFLVVVGVIKYRLNISVHDLFLVHADDLRTLQRSIPWRPIK